MRLVITQNVTADGAVEMLTDWFDPSDQDQELAAELRRQDESCDAVLLARADRRHHRRQRPAQPGDQVRGQRNDHRSAVAQQRCWRVVLTGSNPGPPADREGLADEFRMFRCPAVQGTGRRFFPEGYAARLARVDARTFGNGVTYVAYRPTGSHDA